ncbi:unnamed protein product [Meloidogyne enterolobii]|uniref:Uncharacterized protein n=1 Tax=Meloidogyne enterolobii TaxID=390850 RepID=A0ACB0XYA9_MELEN
MRDKEEIEDIPLIFNTNNDHQTYHHHPHHHQPNNYLPQNLNDGIIQQQKQPPNNNIIRSHSTAIFCVPSPSTQQNNNLIDNSNNFGINKQQDYRRTKSIVLPPTNGNGRQTENNFNKNNSKTSLTTPSLRRFNSQLRSPCRYSSDSLNPTTPSGTLPPFKPYTPPPILSPMRQGSGLFNKIASSQKECLFVFKFKF